MSGDENGLIVRFLGVRGSHPVAAAGSLSIGGNTSCVEVRAGNLVIALDAGTGLIALGDKLAAAARAGSGPPRALLLVTHLHHDHTMGFPFFKPAYDRDARIHIAGPGAASRSFRDVFEAAFADPYFPVPPDGMPSQRNFLTLEDGQALAWANADEPPVLLRPGEDVPEEAVVARVFRNLEHPNGGVLNFRIEHRGRSVVMATDVEGTKGAAGDLVDFARGADVLIHDAQYTDEEHEGWTKGWGHSTWRMAVETARKAQARRLVLYHHDPSHDDAEVEAIERLARARFQRAITACEGLEIRV